MKVRNIILTAVLFGLSLSSCGKEVVPSEVRLDVDNVDVSLGIHTEEHNKLLTAEDPDALVGSRTTYYGLTSNSKPRPLSFSWKETNDINQEATRYEVVVSENQDMSNPTKYEAKSLSLDVYNLKINTKYYFRVDSIHSSSIFSSEISSFTIEDSAPRNIYVDGVENIRDLGGWNIGEGRVYKQGLLYRTAQFNYGVGNTYKSAPTEKGLKIIKEELKIKTEIDLRRTVDFDGYDETASITSSPLGNDVQYVAAPMYYGNTNIFTQSQNKQSIQRFFATLSDINNYPIAFHCLRGTDRTGALAYVLGALIGMSEEDLLLDYLFSDLADINGLVRKEVIYADDFYVKGIQSCSGTTLSERAANYLIDTCEISQDTINSVISILVG